VVAVGFALLLTGIGFLVLSLRVLRQPGTAEQTERRPSAAAKVAVGAA
jgi:hypothetical protein